MLRWVFRCLIGALVVLPGVVRADPITLKLSFFTSDRSVAYEAAVKPFVDAINGDASRLLHIDVYLSGKLGRVQNELPQQVINGDVDIAFIVPGRNPERFRDTAVLELPGLFRDSREACLVYTRLIAAHALAGYDDFFVIGAYGTAPEVIHSRKSLTSLSDLKGQTLRVNNLVQAAAFAKLGALPAVLAFNDTSPAISAGLIDGATVPSAQLFDVGIGRLTTYHYLLPTSVAPLALVMNKKVFDRLPDAAKALLTKYSGEWTAEQFGAAYEKINREVRARIEADPRRSVVIPTAADLKKAETEFKAMRDNWIDESQDHQRVMSLTQLELDTIRNPSRAPRAQRTGEDQ